LHSNFAIKLFNGIDQHGAGRACRPCSLRTTNSALSTSSAKASSLVSSASTVAASAFRNGQLYYQQQIAQAFQHGNRLVIIHGDGHQQGNASPSHQRLLLHG
jgi:hypothetical protein